MSVVRHRSLEPRGARGVALVVVASVVAIALSAGSLGAAPPALRLASARPGDPGAPASKVMTILEQRTLAAIYAMRHRVTAARRRALSTLAHTDMLRMHELNAALATAWRKYFRVYADTYLAQLNRVSCGNDLYLMREFREAIEHYEKVRLAPVSPEQRELAAEGASRAWHVLLGERDRPSEADLQGAAAAAEHWRTVARSSAAPPESLVVRARNGVSLELYGKGRREAFHALATNPLHQESLFLAVVASCHLRDRSTAAALYDRVTGYKARLALRALCASQELQL